jgi:hypothetical protein
MTPVCHYCSILILGLLSQFLWAIVDEDLDAFALGSEVRTLFLAGLENWPLAFSILPLSLLRRESFSS